MLSDGGHATESGRRFVREIIVRRQPPNRFQAAVLAVALTAAAAPGQTTSTAPAEAPLPASRPAETFDPSRVDAQAAQVLHGMCDFIRERTSFRLNVRTAVRVHTGDRDAAFTTEYVLAVQRPNRLALVPLPGTTGPSVVCDGQHLYTSLPMLAKYTRAPAPATLDDALSGSPLAALSTAGSGIVFLAGIVRPDPYAAFMQDVTAARYLGTEEVDGRPCHRLIVARQFYEWEVCIEAGAQPLIRRLKPDMARALEAARRSAASQPGGSAADADLAVDTVLTIPEVVLDADLPADLFAFHPPAGAREVESFFDKTAAHRGAQAVGQPAPEVSLDLLGGGSLQLTEYLGRSVMVLEFWSTWRSACSTALKRLGTLLARPEYRDVRCYAVNVEDPPQAVRAFVQRHALTCSVALDSDGTVARALGIDSVPRTVVIDRQGVVRSIRSATTGQWEEELIQDLADALPAAEPETPP